MSLMRMSRALTLIFLVYNLVFACAALFHFVEIAPGTDYLARLLAWTGIYIGCLLHREA